MVEAQHGPKLRLSGSVFPVTIGYCFRSQLGSRGALNFQNASNYYYITHILYPKPPYVQIIPPAFEKNLPSPPLPRP